MCVCVCEKIMAKPIENEIRVEVKTKCKKTSHAHAFKTPRILYRLCAWRILMRGFFRLHIKSSSWFIIFSLSVGVPVHIYGNQERRQNRCIELIYYFMDMCIFSYMYVCNGLQSHIDVVQQSCRIYRSTICMGMNTYKYKRTFRDTMPRNGIYKFITEKQNENTKKNSNNSKCKLHK